MTELRDYQYIDERLVSSFSEQLGLDLSDFSTSEKSIRAGEAKGGLPFVSGKYGGSKEETVSKQVSYSPGRMFNELERKMENEDLVSGEGRLTSLKPRGIVRIEGKVWTSKQFEDISALRDVSPYMSPGTLNKMIGDSMGTEDNDMQLDPRVFLQKLLDENNNAPFALNSSGLTAAFEITKEYDRSSSGFVELLDTRVTLVGQVTEYCSEGEKLEAFNLLKLLGVNRSLRRKMDAAQAKTMIEMIDGPAVRVKPIAIWQ